MRQAAAHRGHDPESLYVLLGSESGRNMLATTRTVIVDEIHALAGNKRGSHLALSLERLAALARQPLRRIGLSATQKPIDEIARFLVGMSAPNQPRPCAVVDTGHVRHRDLAIEVPSLPLQAVMSNEVWQEVYARLAQLSSAHRTTLVFVNTRRIAERAARHLSSCSPVSGDVAPRQHVEGAPAGRRAATQERGIEVLVATASLELGIDIGDVDLVCQLGSPRSIATLRNVPVRSHQVGGVPGRGCSTVARQLVECALLDAVQRHELDRLTIPSAPLDVLAQQIIAEVAATEWPEDAVFDLVRRAYPYRDLEREQFLAVVRLVADGFSTRHGHRAADVHLDAVNGVVLGRRGAPRPDLRRVILIPTTTSCSSHGTTGRHRQRGLRGRSCPAIYRPATPRIAYNASNPAACASRTRMASRRPFPSGWRGARPRRRTLARRVAPA